MATALTPVSVNRNVSNGVDLSAALTSPDAADNTFPNSGVELLRVKTTGTGSTVTVAFATQTPDGVTISPVGKQYTIGATNDRLIGPFPVHIYGSVVTVKYTSVATMTVAVYQPAV